MGRATLWVWTGLHLAYLASGVGAVVFSVFIRMTNPAPGGRTDHTLRSLVISTMSLNSAIALGAFTVLSWLIGTYGIFTGTAKSGKHRTAGLTAYNYSLVAVAAVTTVVGAMLWFFTLRPREEFFRIWQRQTPVVQQFLQDSLQCCGYFDATVAQGFNAPAGFCAPVAASTNTTAIQPCVNPIGAFEDYTLNNVFSLTFGFVAIQIALFLATACVVHLRNVQERFRLIDEKRGKTGGFV